MRRCVSFLWLVGAIGMAYPQCASAAKPPADPCQQYQRGGAYGYKNAAWANAVSYATREVETLHVPSFDWNAFEPARFSDTEARVRAILQPHILMAGACYENSDFAADVASVFEKLEKFRPSPVNYATWAQRESDRIELVNRAAERSARFDAFRATGGTISRHNEYRISVLAAYTYGFGSTMVKLRLENISEEHIIRPTTASYWGHDADSPMVGGVVAIGFELKDNFSNGFPLVHVDKEITSSYGIQPGSSEDFELTFSGAPPAKAQTIVVTILSRTFGNTLPLSFTIPRGIVTSSLL